MSNRLVKSPDKFVLQHFRLQVALLFFAEFSDIFEVLLMIPAQTSPLHLFWVEFRLQQDDLLYQEIVQEISIVVVVVVLLHELI